MSINVAPPFEREAAEKQLPKLEARIAELEAFVRAYQSYRRACSEMPEAVGVLDKTQAWLDERARAILPEAERGEP